MPDPVKLSSSDPKGFWELPVLFEDDDLLALDKPPGLPLALDPDNPAQPSLMALAHRGIERGAPWAESRGLSYLMNAHRVDGETGGVLICVKNKTALVSLAAQFATQVPNRSYVALVRGSSSSDSFETEAKLAPHPLQMGIVRVDPEEGKRSQTRFTVRERFNTCILLEAGPVPDRMHQVRVHLKYLRMPLVGDETYGGPPLLLSKLKPDYHLKPGREERPLINRPALHLEKITVESPSSGKTIEIISPWPKDLATSVRYLRRYSPGAAVTA